MVNTVPEHDRHALPYGLQLPKGEVHIWSASTEGSDEQFISLQGILSADEAQRAGKYYFEHDRMRFVLSRGLLRLIMSRYLDVEPGTISLCYNHFGKPELASISGGNTIQFNISHSGKLVLYAITCGHRVGIDVERIRHFQEAEEIVERFFSAGEKMKFRSLPEDISDRTFLTYWTRKEAYVKALGEGLSYPFHSFCVAYPFGEQGRLIQNLPCREESIVWSIADISIDPQYIAAIAVEGHDIKYCYRKLEWHARQMNMITEPLL